MMRKYSNIVAAKIMNGVLYYSTSDGLLFRNERIFLCGVEKHSFYLHNNLFYYHNDDGKSCIIDINTTNIYKGHVEFSLATLSNNKMVCYYDYKLEPSGYTYKIGLFDMSSMTIIKQSDLLTLDFFAKYKNGFLARRHREELILFIDIEFNLVWQFNVKNLAQYKEISGELCTPRVEQIIGIYNDLLWIHIGGFRLIALNVATGELIYQTETIPVLSGLSKEEGYHFNLRIIHLDEQSGVLKMFAHRYYIEFDINRMQAVVKKDFGKGMEDAWRIMRSVFYQSEPNKLFFCGCYKALRNPNAFGIFDTEKAEIIWYETKKPDEGFFYNPPQANDKLLVALDDQQNLFIYDRKDLATINE